MARLELVQRLNNDIWCTRDTAAISRTELAFSSRIKSAANLRISSDGMGLGVGGKRGAKIMVGKRNKNTKRNAVGYAIRTI